MGKRAHKGVAIVEYAVLVALIGGVAIATVLSLGGGVTQTFEQSNEQMVEQTARPNPTPGVSAGQDPNGVPLGRTNRPGGGPSVPPVFYADYADQFSGTGHESFAFATGFSCVADVATHNPTDPMGAPVWCTSDGEAARPSNLQWRVNNANEGAPIWHGQTCLYDTAQNDFVRNKSFSIEQAGFTTIAGMSTYDGTWLLCTAVGEPEAVLGGSNGQSVTNTTETTTYWTAGSSYAGLPSSVTMVPAPSWASFSGGMPWLGAGVTSYPPGAVCPYSSDLERYLTLSYRQSGIGDLFGWIPCQ